MQASYSTDTASSSLPSSANNEFKQILNVLSGVAVGSGKKDCAGTTGETDCEQSVHEYPGMSLSDEDICDVLQAAIAGHVPVDQLWQLLALGNDLSTKQMLHNLPFNPAQSGLNALSPEALALLAQLSLQSNGDTGVEQMTGEQLGFEKSLAETPASASLAAAVRGLNQTDGTILSTAAGQAAETMRGTGMSDVVPDTAQYGNAANTAAGLSDSDPSSEQLLRQLLAYFAGNKTDAQNGIPLTKLVAQWQLLLNNLTQVNVNQDGSPGNATGSGLTTPYMDSEDFAIALLKANRPAQGTVTSNSTNHTLTTNTAAHASGAETETNKEAAITRSGSAMQTGTTAALPVSKQTLIFGSANQQTYSVNKLAANTLSGETVKETGGNSQQLDGAQVIMNLTSSTADTAKTAGSEAPALLKSSDNALFMQLADAVRGQVNKDGQGQTQVRLQLHPANLGEVNIKLTYRDGNIMTHFHAATEQARQAIENSLPQLREVLAGHQLNLESATVSAGDEGNRWAQRENQGQQYKKRGSHLTVPGRVTETITGTEPATAMTGDANRLNSFA